MIASPLFFAFTFPFPARCKIILKHPLHFPLVSGISTCFRRSCLFHKNAVFCLEHLFAPRIINRIGRNHYQPFRYPRNHFKVLSGMVFIHTDTVKHNIPLCLLPKNNIPKRPFFIPVRHNPANALRQPSLPPGHRPDLILFHGFLRQKAAQASASANDQCFHRNFLQIMLEYK